MRFDHISYEIGRLIVEDFSCLDAFSDYISFTHWDWVAEKIDRELDT